MMPGNSQVVAQSGTNYYEPLRRTTKLNESIDSANRIIITYAFVICLYTIKVRFMYL